MQKDKFDQKKSFWIFLYLKGMAMGAADIVPGVSGGTIAFISGIYLRLLAAISSVSWSLLSILRTKGLLAVWRAVDGNFLLVLLLGIATSVLSFANLLSWMLATYPIPLWSFFFGLILASAWVLFKALLSEEDVQRSGRANQQDRASGENGANSLDSLGSLNSTDSSNSAHRERVLLSLLFAVGAIFAFLITIAVPVTIEASYWTLFLAGAVAICAMILPGISGSFILLLMGLYTTVLTAIKSLDLITVAVFASGCLVGLLSFARILSWLFSRYRREVIALLVGVMLGSLNKVWPWKETITTRINSHGESVPLLQANVAPYEYLERVGQEPFIVLALIMALLGIGLVLGLEKANRR